MPAWAGADTITLTTYFPSPFAVYQRLEVLDELRLVPQTPKVGACDPGAMYVSDVGVGDIYVCDSTGAWTQAGNLWKQIVAPVDQSGASNNANNGGNDGYHRRIGLGDNDVST